MKKVMSSAATSGLKNLNRATEFAAMAGVSVRTLHHYNHLGLLKPSGRSAAGSMLYGGPRRAKVFQKPDSNEVEQFIHKSVCGALKSSFSLWRSARSCLKFWSVRRAGRSLI